MQQRRRRLQLSWIDHAARITLNAMIFLALLGATPTTGH